MPGACLGPRQNRNRVRVGRKCDCRNQWDNRRNESEIRPWLNEGLVSVAGILKRNDARGNSEQLEATELSLWHWIHCSLVYFSGLFVRIDITHPLYDGRLADFTLSENEDLIPVLTPVLTPNYRGIGILRYLTNSFRLAYQMLSASILTFFRNKKPNDEQQMLERSLFMHACSTDVYNNWDMFWITKKTCPLPHKYVPVNW